MAKPREPVKPDPPVESEDEEEEEEGSSGEEPEPGQKKAASTPAPGPKKREATASSSSSSSSTSEDEESGSDTDSDSPAKIPDPNIKPIASKPMDDPKKTPVATKKPRSKPNSSWPTSPTKSTIGAGAKRPAASEEGKDAKRTKKKSEAEVESSERKGDSNDDSRKLFQRLWSEDDEIAILKGMLDYSAKNKADPVADLNAFHEFIKKNLHIDVSRSQLQNKIRRLRKKYENNAVRERKDSKERSFSQPHEQKAYDLSKKIWGKERNGGVKETIESPKFNGTAVRKSRSKSAVETAAKIDEVKEKVKEVKDLVDEKNVVQGLKNVSFGPDSLRIEEWVLKNGMDSIKDEKKRGELEEKWRELKVKEIELLARKSELMAEQTRLILDGLKSSGH